MAQAPEPQGGELWRKLPPELGREIVGYLPSEVTRDLGDNTLHHEILMQRYIDLLRLYGHIDPTRRVVDPEREQEIYRTVLDYVNLLDINYYMGVDDYETGYLRGREPRFISMTTPFFYERHLRLDSEIPENARGRTYTRSIIGDSSGWSPPEDTYHVYFPPEAERLSDGIVIVDVKSDGSLASGEVSTTDYSREESQLAIKSALNFCDYSYMKISKGVSGEEVCRPPHKEQLFFVTAIRSIINEVYDPDNREIEIQTVIEIMEIVKEETEKAYEARMRKWEREREEKRRRRGH